MIFPLVCMAAGALVMGRRAPKTQVRKLLCLGPRSGIVYTVEDLPEVGTVIVRAPADQAIAQFLRASVKTPGTPGLIWQNGRGAPEMLAWMRRDFGLEPQKPAAVPAGANAPSSPQSSVADGKTAAAQPRAAGPQAQQAGRSTP